MLITELKAKETILSLAQGKVFLLNCHAVVIEDRIADTLVFLILGKEDGFGNAEIDGAVGTMRVT